MKKNSLFTRLAVVLLIFCCLAGCERKTKEQLLQEGVALKNSNNMTGAIVLFKNVLEKDPNFFEARYQLALTYVVGGQYAKAEKELEKILLQDPDNTEVQLQLAKVYTRTDRFDETIVLVEKLLQKQGPSPIAYELLGTSFAEKGDLTKAETYFKKALDLEPARGTSRNALASIYLRIKQWDTARTLLSETIKQDSTNIEAYYLLMQLEALNGDIDQAVIAGRRIIEISPGEVRAPYLLGLLELNRGSNEAALKLAEGLIARHPKHPAGARLQGLAFFADGKYQQAVEPLQSSLGQMSNPSGLYFLGLAHYKLGQFELALNQFQAVLDSAPDHIKARLMVALTLYHQDRLEDSRYAVEKVLSDNPKNPLAHDILGSIFIAQGDYDRGMEELDRAIELAPDLVESRLKKGFFNLAQGHSDKAEFPLEEALRIAPELLNSRLLLVTSYLQQQNYAQAITTLQEGLQGTPEDAVLHNYLAAAYWGQEKADAAIAELRKAKQLKPDYFAPYFNLANYYLVKEDSAKAVAEYQQLLKIAPDNLRALLSLAVLQELRGDEQGLLDSLAKARATGSAEGFQASAAYLSRNGQPEKALQFLQAGVELNPRHPGLLEQQGRELMQQERPTEALVVFRSLAAEQPNSGLPLLVATLLQLGQVAEAEQVANREIDQHPTEPRGYLLLAKIYKEQKDFVKQEKVLKEGLSRVQDDALLNTKLAEVYVDWQRPERALEIFAGVRNKHPQYVPAIFKQAALYDRLGNKRQARELYLDVLKQNSDYVPALNNLAYLYADNYANLDEALAMAARAFRLRPTDPTIMDTLGYVMVRQGRLVEALPYLEKSAAMLPGQPDVQIHLAQAYQGVGQQEKAVEILQKVAAMTNQSQSQQAEKLLRELHNVAGKEQAQ